MQSAVQIPVSDYLAASFRPDCDYIDGEVLERNLGEREHALMQLLLTSYFFEHRTEWRVLALPEQRVQVTPTRFRVPDVCVLSDQAAKEPVVTHPPVACIEILSKDDSLRSIQQRVDDYLNLGVGYVWIIDPGLRRTYVADTHGLHEPELNVLAIPGTPVKLEMDAFFRNFNELL